MEPAMREQFEALGRGFKYVFALALLAAIGGMGLAFGVWCYAGALDLLSP